MHQSEAVSQYEPVVAGVSLVEEGLFFDEDDEEEDESEAAREAEEHNEEQRIATVKKEGEQYVAPCSMTMTMTMTMLLCCRSRQTTHRCGRVADSRRFSRGSRRSTAPSSSPLPPTPRGPTLSTCSPFAPT